MTDENKNILLLHITYIMGETLYNRRFNNRN